MGSPELTTTDLSTSRNTAASGRSSVIDSIWGCTGSTIQKDDLRKRITIPEYLRVAMREAIQNKDVDSVMRHYDMANATGAEPPQPSESPIVVFINAKSGGRHGPELKARLQDLMGEEQVFDLSTVKPDEFVQYGLSCLEKFAALGDTCAKETREKIRIVAAGGDGTVGWVLGCLGELKRQDRDPVPPTGIIPLGTGNDLSRSFGWGGSFPFNWKTATKRILDRVANGPICHLDSWNLVISMPAGEALETPYSLKTSDSASLDQELEIDGELPEKSSYYQGVFYNYFSIGMDAQVAYGFHHLRNEKPYLAQGPLSNKLIYSGYSCKQGWFFAPCSSDPGLSLATQFEASREVFRLGFQIAGKKSPWLLLAECEYYYSYIIRGLNNILRLYVKKVNSSKWEQVPIPSSVRSIVTLNLPSYGSGRNPWGNLKPEYLEKKGFVEAHADDGFVEIFGLKHGWHASMVMVELISAKHIAQASAMRFELRGGEWKEAYMQVDGEPWKQPMNKEFSTFVEIKKVPFQSTMVHGE